MTKEEIIKKIEERRTTDNEKADNLISKYSEMDERILELVHEPNLYCDGVCVYDNCCSYDEFLKLFKKIKKIDKTIKVTGYAVCWGDIQIDCYSDKARYYFNVAGDKDDIIKRVSNGKCHIEDRTEKKVVCSIAGQ